MKEAIKFTGFINHDKVLEYVKFSELCVIPYLDTPLTKVSTPTKMFEYISIGKVVVCPNYGGFSEILGKKNYGLYSNDNEYDLVKKINYLLSDIKLKIKLKSKNFKISKRYNLKNEVKKT